MENLEGEPGKNGGRTMDLPGKSGEVEMFFCVFEVKRLVVFNTFNMQMLHYFLISPRYLNTGILLLRDLF